MHNTTYTYPHPPLPPATNPVVPENGDGLSTTSIVVIVVSTIGLAVSAYLVTRYILSRQRKVLSVNDNVELTSIQGFEPHDELLANCGPAGGVSSPLSIKGSRFIERFDISKPKGASANPSNVNPFGVGITSPVARSNLAGWDDSGFESIIL